MTERASRKGPPEQARRREVLERTRHRKMARSAHAFVRGNTEAFYAALGSMASPSVPLGPPVWICGDCHVGNLGPVGSADGSIRIQIRDLDQTVIGNPAHDLIRLSLSLASAARGSNLPGVTTARMVEAVIDGYEAAFAGDVDADADPKQPKVVRVVMKKAATRTWRHLAEERLQNARPSIPLGKRFWKPTKLERTAIAAVFEDPDVARLATMARARDDDANVKVVDAAYWMKGCSSLGRLRFAVLLKVTSGPDEDLCLVDVKEAVRSAAPPTEGAHMPAKAAARVVAGARHVSPFLGERMRATEMLGRQVVVRELLPEDLKVEIERLTTDQAVRAARFLAAVVGQAHARQMDASTRAAWCAELGRHRTKTLDALSWLWATVVDLLVRHEGDYLEHCRKYALTSVG